MTKQLLCAIVLSFALISIGCQQAPTPPAPKADLKAEAARIMEVDAAWMKAAQAKDTTLAASFFAEDGSNLSPNHPIATGREAIQKLNEQTSKGQTSISWTTTQLVLSESADYAYQVGAYESTETDAKGKPVKEIGKFLTVWKKQPDGTWKVQADCGNPDGPPTPVK